MGAAPGSLNPSEDASWVKESISQVFTDDAALSQLSSLLSTTTPATAPPEDQVHSPSLALACMCSVITAVSNLAVLNAPCPLIPCLALHLSVPPHNSHLNCPAESTSGGEGHQSGSHNLAPAIVQYSLSCKSFHETSRSYHRSIPRRFCPQPRWYSSAFILSDAFSLTNSL